MRDEIEILETIDRLEKLYEEIRYAPEARPGDIEKLLLIQRRLHVLEWVLMDDGTAIDALMP